MTKKTIPGKITAAVIFLAAGLGLLAQQQSFEEQSLVLNIEVPVRVFQNNVFLTDLTARDFELFEDGVEQKIEAVYLVQDGQIMKSDEKKRFAPEIERTLFLFLQVHEYSVRYKDALDRFIRENLLPTDSLYIVTPIKTYRLRDNALGMVSKADIQAQLIEILRTDTLLAASEYRQTISSLSKLAAQLTAVLSGGGERTPNDSFEVADGQDDARVLQDLLLQYSSELTRLETLREIHQMKLLDFARFLKNRPGQKHVFFIYQREFIPTIEPRIMTQYLSFRQEHHDVLQGFSDLFNFNYRDTNFNIEEVQKAYSDSSISIQFLFVTMPAQQEFGIRMEEHSEDVYNAWKGICAATGGYFGSSSRPEILLQSAVEATENYYLIYYTPKNTDFSEERKFRRVSVQVKDRGRCQVLHRIGYYED
jgi:hypothetical protein